MSRVSAFIEGLCRAGAFLSAICMAAIVILIVMEIFLRMFLGFSTMVSSEFSGYLLVGLVAMSLGYTLQHEAHIRITLIWGVLPLKWKNRVDIAVAAVSVAVTGFALYHSVLLVQQTYSRGMTADSMSETPLWIPQTAIPLGLFLFLLQLVNFILRRVRQ
ncbi:MAG: TRAP transporter small permease [Desulfobacteraceae bacterium]|nr:TRAP transporter small permease [Desulfobacteraceae bacterium]